MELWDIYDRQRRTTGRFHVRGTPMGRGEYHLTAFVWVFNRQRELLLTRRAPEKEHYANCWAATGGAALVGETSLQTVRRELREETGIEADEADFHLVRSFREHSTFSDVYFLFHDIPLSALHLQPGETTEARWVSKAGLEALVASGEVAQPDVRRLRQLRDEFRKIWNACDRWASGIFCQCNVGRNRRQVDCRGAACRSRRGTADWYTLALKWYAPIASVAALSERHRHS